jgi:hypothetical protein
MSTQFTEIPYVYADASNYKASEVVFVSGVFTPEQLAAINNKLDSGEFFIPPQVGLEALQQTLDSFPSDDDHVWHSLNIETFSLIEALPEGKSVACSADEFSSRFASVDWDVRKEYDRLGLDDTE